VETTINSLIDNLEKEPSSIFALDENLNNKELNNYKDEVERIIWGKLLMGWPKKNEPFDIQLFIKKEFKSYPENGK